MSLGGTGGTRPGSRLNSTPSLPENSHAACLADLRALPLSLAQDAELKALESESDPEIFYRDLIGFGIRQEQSGQFEAAAKTFATLLKASTTEPLRQLAEEQLHALLGRGALGPRAEFLLRRLTQETLDPSTLLAMGVAGSVFKLTRFVTLGKLLSAPEGLLTRGLGARSLSVLAGFAAEAPAFTLSTKLARGLVTGPQDWSPSTLGKELASSYLVLGALKFTGMASSTKPFLFQQGAMLSGILLGHALEQGLSLKPSQDGATTLIDSLALLLQFHVAGNLSRMAFGRNFETWQQRLELQTRALSLQPQALQPGLVMAMVGLPAEPEPSPVPTSAVHERRPQEAPPDEGMLGRDAVKWGANLSRGPKDVRLVSTLGEKIRKEMWLALNVRVESPLARAIANRLPLTVRLLPVDGSLDNYDLELHTRDLAPQGDTNEVRFHLDSAKGSLRLLDYLPNAVWELRQGPAEASSLRGFIPFYRSVTNFQSDALKAQALVDTLSSEAREYVLMDPTQDLPPRAPESASPPEKAGAKGTGAPKPATTLLTRYFPRIQAGLTAGVDRYLDQMMIPGKAERRRLHGLMDIILTKLHDRELDTPLLAQQSSLQVWIRPSEQNGKRRQIEVLTAGEALRLAQEKPPGEHDIMLMLIRFPNNMGVEVPVLEHQYLRTNPKNPSMPAGADLEFQRDLGLGDHFRLSMPVEELHLSPHDLGTWETWMQENGPFPAPPSGT